MSVGTNAALVAAAAAAAARRREEEQMTSYSPSELAEDWEFKILRSNGNAFRSPETLRVALEEEARAGWRLVEKFDDGRLRLKRPASCRALDPKLDFDAYRTVYGLAARGPVLILVGVLLGLLALLLILVISIRR